MLSLVSDKIRRKNLLFDISLLGVSRRYHSREDFPLPVSVKQRVFFILVVPELTEHFRAAINFCQFAIHKNKLLSSSQLTLFFAFFSLSQFLRWEMGRISTFNGNHVFVWHLCSNALLHWALKGKWTINKTSWCFVAPVSYFCSFPSKLIMSRWWKSFLSIQRVESKNLLRKF